MRNYSLILLSVLFTSCAIFKSKPNIDANTLQKLNGKYSIFPMKDTVYYENVFEYYENVNEKIYRKYKSKDTLKLDSINDGYVKVSVLNNKQLKFVFIENDKILKSQIIKYKIKKNGFLYLKNRNTIISGLPYILGGIDIKRVRIAINTSNNLLINDVYDRSSALLILLGTSRNGEHLNLYQRLE